LRPPGPPSGQPRPSSLPAPPATHYNYRRPAFRKRDYNSARNYISRAAIFPYRDVGQKICPAFFALAQGFARLVARDLEPHARAFPRRGRTPRRQEIGCPCYVTGPRGPFFRRPTFAGFRARPRPPVAVAVAVAVAVVSRSLVSSCPPRSRSLSRQRSPAPRRPSPLPRSRCTSGPRPPGEVR
jgi:hypothetical protein